jgi:hypothetical protein
LTVRPDERPPKEKPMRLAHNRAAAALTLAFATTATAAPQAKPAPRTDAAGGIQWTVPSRWTSGAGSSMRVATYSVPGPKSASAGECAVFFFGAGQGGSVDDNVARWAKQFEGSPTPVKKTAANAAGLRVTRAELSGTYLAPGGPMMQSTGKRSGYRLLGAIVEAPEGNVFFKLTGEAATVAAAQADFDALVTSLRKK